ncbi:hypothetical protein AB0J74_36695 [Asanoa sp. NPDC049573]|uniref:hypothetical protein n=1 Tax=Asanoa sp. NPDC049573 TaxID=3155396 RepID=UPI00341A1756
MIGGNLVQTYGPTPIDRGFVVATILGTVGILAATGALLVGSTVLLLLLVSDIVLRWLVTTIRHLVLGSETRRPAARLAAPRTAARTLARR